MSIFEIAAAGQPMLPNDVTCDDVFVDAIDGPSMLDGPSIARGLPSRRCHRGFSLWRGVRSSDLGNKRFMSFVRAQKLQRKNSMHDQRELAGLRMLRDWHTRRQLRVGDTVVPPRSACTVHRNRWRSEGVLFSAFREVGGRAAGIRSRGECALRKTHRSLLLASATAAIHEECQRRALDSILQLARAGRLTAIFIGRHYDATPLCFDYGRLAPRVAPHGRYFLPKDDGHGWRSLRLDELQQVTRRTGFPAKGVLEAFAQSVDIAWLDTDGHIAQQEILCKPVTLQNGTGSTLFAAVEAAVPSLDIESTIALSLHVPFVFVSEAPAHVLPIDAGVQRRTKQSLASLIFSRSHSLHVPHMSCIASPSLRPARIDTSVTCTRSHTRRA